MSDKALFVMNMPECCTKCGFFFYLDEDAAYCEKVTDPDDSESFRAIKEDYCQCKPDWCPLKPVPEKKLVVLDTLDCYGNGWNDCIDKILEECNEKS